MDGVYQINASVVWEPAAVTNGRVAIRAYSSNLAWYLQDAGTPISSTGRMTSSLNFARRLTQGEKISFYISQSSGADMTIQGNVISNAFSIHYLHN